MDTLIHEVINQRFNYLKADELFQIYALLDSYNYQDHTYELLEVIGTKQLDDTINLDQAIIGIFEDALYQLLIKLFIVPSSHNLSDNHKLLGSLFLLENTFDSKELLEIIDSATDEKEALVNAMEHLGDIDWATLQDIILEVKPTLIKLLRNLHESKVEADIEQSPANLLETRRPQIIGYFAKETTTMTQQYITHGQLGVPSPVSRSLGVMTKPMYAFYEQQNYRAIALDAIAMALIAPVTDRSVIPQAKKLVKDLFTDTQKVILICIEIDKIVKSTGLFK